MKRDHVIDAFTYEKALARYANDAKGLNKVKELNNNAEYVEDGLKVYIESRKDIPAGGEILVDYGKEYWETIRFNLKLNGIEKKRK